MYWLKYIDSMGRKDTRFGEEIKHLSVISRKLKYIEIFFGKTHFIKVRCGIYPYH